MLGGRLLGDPAHRLGAFVVGDRDPHGFLGGDAGAAEVADVAGQPGALQLGPDVGRIERDGAVVERQHVGRARLAVGAHHVAQRGQLAEVAGLVGDAHVGRRLLGLGQLLQPRPGAGAVAIGEALQRVSKLRRGLRRGALGLPVDRLDVDLRGGIVLHDLRGQLRVVGARGFQRGGHFPRRACRGPGLGAGGLQPGLQRGELLGLAVVGHLALADQRHLVLGLQALGERLPRGVLRRSRLDLRHRRRRRAGEQRRQQRASQDGPPHARPLATAGAPNDAPAQAATASGRFCVADTWNAFQFPSRLH